MSGYFTLELDTTGPNIDIYAPTYTDRQSNNEIRIVSSEKLAEYQNIYIIDSQGVRHDVIFAFNGDNEYVGNIVFNDYPIGVTTIFAQLEDEVHNPSNLVSFHISVITTNDNLMLRLSMLEMVRTFTMDSAQRVPVMNEVEMKENLSEISRKTTISEKSRLIRVSEIN